MLEDKEVRHSQTVWFTITVLTSYLNNSCVMLWAKAFSSERVKLFFRYWITYTSHLLFMSLPIQCPPPTCKIIWSPDTGDRLPFFSLQLVHIKLYKLYNLIYSHAQVHLGIDTVFMISHVDFASCWI